jgi:hypothetical protein
MLVLAHELFCPPFCVFRLYVIFLELASSIVFGTTIALITKVITSVDIGAQKEAERLAEVTSFVSFRQFPHRLARRIRRHFRNFYRYDFCISYFFSSTLFETQSNHLLYSLAIKLQLTKRRFLMSSARHCEKMYQSTWSLNSWVANLSSWQCRLRCGQGMLYCQLPLNWNDWYRHLRGITSHTFYRPNILMHRLLPLLQPAAFETGERVCIQGDNCEEVTVIINGILTATTHLEGEPRPRLVRTLTKGGSINALCVLAIWYQVRRGWPKISQFNCAINLVRFLSVGGISHCAKLL